MYHTVSTVRQHVKAWHSRGRKFRINLLSAGQTEQYHLAAHMTLLYDKQAGLIVGLFGTSQY